MSERPTAYVARNVYYIDFGHGKCILRPERTPYNNQAFPLAEVIPINKCSKQGDMKKND